MTPWMLASAALLAALVPGGIVALGARDPMNRLVGLEMTAVVSSLLLVTLAEAFQRVYLFDLAIVLALLSFGGGLVFARFLERWL